MGKINILSPEICNRISAGEVIERPYSVVKELIENSIDAGATEITVSVVRGGKEQIKVSDNGCGIERDDMRAAFFAHATSKISTVDDVYKITTLGFRGEALATISSVAKVTLISSVDGEEANKVECDGEFIGKVQPAAGHKGTEITVCDLFFNTPARYKFMRTDKKEETDVTNLVTKYILGNPKIAFKYYADGKLLLQSYGGGLEEAIAQVYGASYLPHCFSINADRNNIKLYGFISNQNFFKPNKTYQSLYLNGRFISNSIISSAITNAYAPYAMKKQYPFYALFIDVPPDIVDVNVHPNKTDVRFVDNQVVYGTVYKVVSSVLDGTAQAADFVVSTKIVPEIKSTSQENSNRVYASEMITAPKVYDDNFDGVAGIEQFTQKPAEIKKTERVEGRADEPQPDYSDYEEPKKFNPYTDLEVFEFYGTNKVKNELYVCSGGGDSRALDELLAAAEKVKAKQARIEFESCKYRGTLFNTYLLYEICDDVYMIDQHAAHERMIYDKLNEKLKNRQIVRQPLISPYILDVNQAERAFIDENIRMIRSLGFNIEPFGMLSFRISEVPVDLQDINIEEFFKEILADLNGLKEIKLEELLKDRIATTACKHAIKGGKQLTESERKKLLAMLDGNMGLKCPHGRPICIKLTKTEIEKMFKRIV